MKWLPVLSGSLLAIGVACSDLRGPTDAELSEQFRIVLSAIRLRRAIAPRTFVMCVHRLPTRRTPRSTSRPDGILPPWEARPA